MKRPPSPIWKAFFGRSARFALIVGASTRSTTTCGLHKCRENRCRKQFTVKVGTVFESAHIPLHKALQAVYLMFASKKGVSAHQIHRILGVTYKTAWFLCHRIREALRTGELSPMGGNGLRPTKPTLVGKRARSKTVAPATRTRFSPL